MSTTARFLVVDDEIEVCNFFSYLLRNKGYAVETANTGKEAFDRLDSFQFNVALVDLKLPDGDGLGILKIIKDKQPQCEVIIITGYSTVKSAVQAIQLGAFDYVEKPFVDIEEMENLLDRALNIRAELEKLDIFQEEYGFVVGKNPKMLRVVAAAKRIAKKNITVLIQGETGTGKEVLARYVHAVSHRNDRPFLAFNCGAFTETLLESELFGHEKGSFTGAGSRKRGIFELAHKGTLFLDEINSASPAIQIKLLRVLETGEFLRVGGEELCKVDVRIIAATNANLQAEVENNQFREDLFYRLDVASLYIPALRERSEDIPLFINFFLDKESKAKGVSPKTFGADAMDILISYSWPGNIRELANTVAQAVLLGSGPALTPADLPPRIIQRLKEKPQSPAGDDDLEVKTALPPRPASKETTLQQQIPGAFAAHPQAENLVSTLEQFESILLGGLNLKQGFSLNELQNDLKNWHNDVVKKIIGEALDTTFGNQVKAADILSITPRALRYYLKERQKTS